MHVSKQFQSLIEGWVQHLAGSGMLPLAGSDTSPPPDHLVPWLFKSEAAAEVRDWGRKYYRDHSRQRYHPHFLMNPDPDAVGRMVVIVEERVAADGAPMDVYL